MSGLLTLFGKVLRDVTLFSQHASGIKLRKYQKEVACAIVRSVCFDLGLTFVVVFPRQSGKNELQAQIEAYLLTLFSRLDCEIVKASPTWKPQTLNAMRRLERILKRNLITRGRWVKESGYIYRFGSARIFFLSGGTTANVVGATANTLLECDEAQDVVTSKWDKDFAPMAASTNATRVFWGTAWTSRTLLARELRAARAQESADGIRRVWVLSANDVAKEVPAYGKFVSEQINKLGRNHPMVKTQYFSEEIDAQGGMFPPERIALMVGNHPSSNLPLHNHLYAILIDVAGEDENSELAEYTNDLKNPGRDSTVVTVVEVDTLTVQDPLIRVPTYRVQCRYTWTGVKHTRIYSAIHSIIDQWGPKYVVVDSTGVGQGLTSFLDRAYPGKVIPYLFTSKSKSDLGWKFLAVVETGRYKEPIEIEKDSVLWAQLRCCQAEVLEGPGKVMRWGVPDGTRDPDTGELVHDDLVLSAALCGVLDDLDWSVSGAPLLVARADPLGEIDGEGF